MSDLHKRSYKTAFKETALSKNLIWFVLTTAFIHQ